MRGRGPYPLVASPSLQPVTAHPFQGGRGGGGTHSLLALVIRRLTTYSVTEGGVGGYTQSMHNRFFSNIDLRTLTTTAGSTSGVHPPGKHRVHQAPRCSASRIKGAQHLALRPACQADFGTLCVRTLWHMMTASTNRSLSMFWCVGGLEVERVLVGVSTEDRNLRAKINFEATRRWTKNEYIMRIMSLRDSRYQQIV